MAPRSSRPTTWNEFLPISMPITATALLRFWDMACSFVFAAPCQIRRWRGRSTAGTIPLAEASLHAPNFVPADTVDAAVPRTEVTMGEHPIGQAPGTPQAGSARPLLAAMTRLRGSPATFQ